MTIPLPIFCREEQQDTPADGPLRDTFGRVHTNLRISVTDRCNLRCRYCMPEDVTFLDRSEILSFDEIRRFTTVAATLGVTKVRLTGGEPLLRRGIDRLVAMLHDIPGLNEVALTTNGTTLSGMAGALWSAGLRRITVSLDTLDPETFRRVARRDALADVLAGIRAARELGFVVKLNAVILRGINDADIIPLAGFARETGCELRYIESMPIGADSWDRKSAVLAEELIETVAREFGPMDLVEGDPHAPAMTYCTNDGHRIGVIASVSRPFCSQCNRIRLTAEGMLRHCLFALFESDAKSVIRFGTDRELERLIRRVVWSKWEGHEINSAKFVKPTRTMHAIGG
ncbi:MAG: GTP 3',8-cyclase MoaA [Gemmataceae bacterium]|nr:GTP 3',8-cyclase MoaA [Gemmataceae bacterium]